LPADPRQRFTFVAPGRNRFTNCPTAIEEFIKWLARNGPATLNVPTWCSNAVTPQPQCEQSGFPPKTHG
jgi:hypothetical protein